MGLLTAQLLFVEPLDADSVRLDVIVLDRAEAPASPLVGAPLALGFGMPGDEDERARAVTVLENWARRGAAVDITIRTTKAADEVVLRNGVASIALQPRTPDGAPGVP
jgi:hypothetical protein